MRKRTDGFTLVELMVVVLIIGILVAVAVPVFKAARTTAEKNTCQANQRTWAGVVQQARANGDEPAGTGDLKRLGAGGVWDSAAAKYLKSIPVCPTSKTAYWVREAPAGSSANGHLYGCAGASSAEWSDGHLLAAVGSSQEMIVWQGITYKVIVAEDGREWLDRNLGAAQVATRLDDPDAYGWYYQWGRGNDTHQYPTSGVTTTLSPSSTPDSGEFITTNAGSNNWLKSPGDVALDKLWTASGGSNNPCPPGFHVPSQAEWAGWVNALPAATPRNAHGAFGSALKLPLAGWRNYSDALPGNTGVSGYYWSSSPTGGSSLYVYLTTGGIYPTNGCARSYGFPIRAIRD